MGPSELLNELKKRGYNVRWLSKEMNSNGVNASTSTIYKKIRGVSQFTVPEIKVIQEILGLNNDEMYHIFFGELVS
ncbi:hypothetical protein NE293_10305 [Latilactobacillus curvatus]|uniref:hypothetical protein n=1 Tax=Latilactobacillus curvatus TaxID=28038 RepID=UPI000849FC51|nr:hypothetical protein [Latilactobacillus curvatus]AOO75985.1 hypothetical protein LCW_07925 [Latilactobacillus curvatus]MCM6845034.1 hypothetical protein [Latilactobacillus curvatus]MCM6862066.1 hypothetical protein [Latilactobacillus curvatus]MCM6869506.1 hypothetical protein [Latilactobacillus curvatus]MDG2983962.1 hypothetical protein [Latilactobacillus curvatus]